VLEESGVAAVSYPTLNRRLPAYGRESWRKGLSEACARHARLGPASVVLNDVSSADRTHRRCRSLQRFTSGRSSQTVA
jgi:hypothetical protein